MSRGLNKVMLIGHLGRDPEVRHLQSGDPVANFSLATTRRWRDRNSNELKEQTEWHNISCFGRLAETVTEYLKKGSQCYVEGEIRTRSFERDGVTQYRTEVNARDVYFLGARGRDEGGFGSRGVPDEAPRGTAHVSKARDRGAQDRNSGDSKKFVDDVEDFTPDTEDDLPF